MQDKAKEPKTYLGDGVYLEFHGDTVCAFTERLERGESVQHYIHFDLDMLEDMTKWFHKQQAALAERLEYANE
jgi:hypothetical protein